ncbi:DUF1289 domain-containing protein [Paracoccus rhizosphaerae]|uniref:DUF1289 domain-containing protein n=1 Tax=Paracoccus rhizosphaerae TaxID=1133347 RepID=A0ABV6CI42_9RHOB|nr:DUF1289 domain-containing protein [Paracoccus rhizosphaerae]
MTRTIDSPCVGICTLDADRQICTGCLRSIDEITSWGRLTPEARQRVIRDLPARRRATSSGA